MLILSFVILLALATKLLRDEGQYDRALLLKISNGDQSALSELYDRYSKIVFSLLFSILKKKVEAEDELQEVFTTIWLKADKFDQQKGSAYTWIISLARNKAIDRLRSKIYKEQQRQSKSIDDDDSFYQRASGERTGLDNAILADRASFVRTALSKISESQQQILKVAYFDGLSQSEISESLNIPLGTVKTRMRAGMKQLRELLAEIGNE